MRSRRVRVAARTTPPASCSLTSAAHSPVWLAPLRDADLFQTAVDGLYIDAQHSRHFSRFFNHDVEWSCNLAIVHGYDPRFGPIIRMFAARDIAAGDELTFDYGPTYWKERPDVMPVETQAE